MNKIGKIAVVVALLIVVVVMIAMKQRNTPPESEGSSALIPAKETSLPRLVDLGADKCIPCKMMAPILEALKKEYAGRLQVEFIDVWKNPGAGNQYSINLIPTQIFINASGKELFRHEGFMSKEDILTKWKELGVDLWGKAEQAK